MSTGNVSRCVGCGTPWSHHGIGCAPSVWGYGQDKDAEIARLRAALDAANRERAALNAALTKEREACDQAAQLILQHGDGAEISAPDGELGRWLGDHATRRAAEAKANPYPFTVESSPSAPEGTVAVVRDVKVVGGITVVTETGTAPDCRGELRFVPPKEQR